MRFSVGAVSALAVLFLSACGGNAQPPPALPTPPAVTQFEVDKTRIAAGETVTFSWTTTNATSVEIVDQTGTPLKITGDASSGSATATPVVTTFYVLKVTGEGGRDTAFVQVAVDEDLQEVFLVAVPPVVDAGETVQLLWSAPGARSAHLQSTTGMQIPLETGSGSGVVELIPARTSGYTLVASGVDEGAELTSTVEVKVQPVIDELVLQPAVAHVGENVRFAWKTSGAGELSISEATWGELHRITFAADGAKVDDGSFEWTIPATRPTGETVLDGMPLRFTVTVKQGNPAVTLTRKLSGYVGEGPVIEAFLAPDAVTVGKPVTFEWRTVNAVSVKILANGLPIWETLPSQVAAAQKGVYTLPELHVDTVFQLVATSHLGASSFATHAVDSVALPKIQSFSFSGAVNAAGEAATVEWVTQDATTVLVRAKNGATTWSSDDPATVASGTAAVYPGQRTPFELVAYNAAGDFDLREATVDVVTPGTLSATPSPITPGETVSVDWTVDAAVTAQLVGDPLQIELRNNPAQHFYDLDQHVDADEVAFDDPDEGVREIVFPAGFTFPFAGTLNARAWVSTNGFVSFSAEAPGPDNEPLDSATVPLPAMIAPFWDDLTLGTNGQVLQYLEGSAFPRRMIIQWNEVQTDETSALTFQLQLLETGEFRFVYGSLSGTDAFGENANIGWRLNATLAKELGIGGALLSPDDELAFFSAGAMSGTYSVAVERKGAFTLFGRLSNDDYVLYSAPVNVIRPGSVKVSEAMITPDVLSPSGRWIELHNAGDVPVDLEGTTLSSSTNGTYYTLPTGLTVPPGGFVLLGESTDPSLNGGAPVEFAWSGLTPDSAGDTLVLAASGPVSSLGYTSTDLVAGTSVQPPEQAITAAGTPVTCTRTQTFGPNLAVGTPGAENESCYAYRLKSIPLHYVDLSASSAPVSTTALETIVDLRSAPFPYYGQMLTQLNVSRYGYMTGVDPDPTMTSTNKSAPKDSSPKGTIAPFWDYLYPSASFADAGVYLGRMEPGADPRAPLGHWILQYHHMRNATADDMNFQAKLFDDGTIEFHYAAMISGTTTNYASGTSATTWIESPAGDSALPVGINASYMQSNVAWRFSPVAQGN